MYTGFVRNWDTTILISRNRNFNICKSKERTWCFSGQIGGNDIIFKAECGTKYMYLQHRVLKTAEQNQKLTLILSLVSWFFDQIFPLWNQNLANLSPLFSGILRILHGCLTWDKNLVHLRCGNCNGTKWYLYSSK